MSGETERQLISNAELLRYKGDGTLEGNSVACGLRKRRPLMYKFLERQALGLRSSLSNGFVSGNKSDTLSTKPVNDKVKNAKLLTADILFKNDGKSLL